MSDRPITLAGLRGFDATARLESLTAAAKALHLSQSAVSRQVQGLEEELGFALFTRTAREISLTPAGKAFFPVVRKMLAELDQAVERGRQQNASPRVSITTFASFASLWLIPRLGELRAIAPGLDIEIGAVDRVVDIEAEGIDVAIRYLSHSSAPPGAVLLMDEFLFPLASRDYLARAAPLRSAADLLKHPLIEAAAGRPSEIQNAWPAFLAAHGITQAAPRPALRLDLISQGMQAARRSQGIALAHTYGADSYIEGDLVPALPLAYRPLAGTYCIVAQHARNRAHAQMFVQWLQTAAADFNAQLQAWLKAHPATLPKKRRGAK
jgi:LysR family transcriptional regulator, glycine cleavage system transcriptional activator